MDNQEQTVNFITIVEDTNGEEIFSWALCQFTPKNGHSIDEMISSIRDKDGAISTKMLNALIEDHDGNIIAKSDSDNAFTDLCDFAGGKKEALKLLSHHGFEVIEPNQQHLDCAP